MKKFYMLSLLSLLFSYPVFAGPVIVPKAVKASMKLYFKDISNVRWEKIESGALKAIFIQNGKEMHVYFSPAGELKRIDMDVRWVDLPVEVRSYIAKNYRKGHLDSIKQNQDENSEAPYIVEIRKRNKSKKLYFSKSGELVFYRDLD